MKINYHDDRLPAAEEIIELYNRASLPRPTGDKQRIRKMFNNASLVISAWDGNKLVGVCRCITDWVWCCYLSDLAVDPQYKKSGIGRELIELTKAKVGEQCMILLLSVPTAMEYYPKVGFAKEDRGFIINRTR
jgi:N-acetylglutamate synthase-like GNAT family acetyltransferase